MGRLYIGTPIARKCAQANTLGSWQSHPCGQAHTLEFRRLESVYKHTLGRVGGCIRVARRTRWNPDGSKVCTGTHFGELAVASVWPGTHCGIPLDRKCAQAHTLATWRSHPCGQAHTWDFRRIESVHRHTFLRMNTCLRVARRTIWNPDSLKVYAGTHFGELAVAPVLPGAHFGTPRARKCAQAHTLGSWPSHLCGQAHALEFL